MVCGTRGDPGTVAPFRAWRGSRDLVAQSPKFHAPALAQISRECREKSSTASPAQPECSLGFIQFVSDFLPPRIWRRSGSRFCCRSIRRLHLGRVHPIYFEWAHAVDLYDGFALAHRKMAHLFWHRNEVSDVHGLQFGFVKRFSRAHKKCSLQHGEVLVRGMPVRWNLNSVSTADAQDKRRSFGTGVAGNRCEFATLHDRRPFQIAKVHDLVRLGALLFLLAVNSRCRYCESDQCRTHISQLILFHNCLLRRNGTTSFAKHTPLAAPGQYKDKVRLPNWPFPMILDRTGNIFKKPHPAFRESSILVSDGVPPHPPRILAQLG